MSRTAPNPPPAPATPLATPAAGGVGSEQTHRTLSSAVRVVSSVTLLSRLGGMLRDVLITRIFGATAVGSAFQFAFKLPNTFRRLFGEGALSAAFLPEYTRAVKNAPETAGPFASLTVLALAGITTALMLVIDLGLVIALLVLPHDPDRSLSFQLTLAMSLFMPPICIAAILGGMLQVHGRFGPASSGPLLLNALMIGVAIYFISTGQRGGATAAYVLSLATVASGFTQCLWFAKILRPHVRWTAAVAAARPQVRVMLRRFFPVLLGMGTLQINTYLDSLIVMWPIWVGDTIAGFRYPLEKGSQVVLQNAERLYQFPLGVFGIAVATAIFPLLSRHADEPSHFAQTLRRGLRLSLFIGLPSSIGLVLIRHDIIDILYGFGRSGLKQEALDRGAATLAGFAPGIWAYSLNHVFTRAFYAKGDTKTPMRLAIGMVALNFCLNCALIWPLREAGLAAATSVTAALQCLILSRLARRLTAEPILDGAAWSGVLRTGAAAAAMAGVVLVLQRFFPAPAGWTGHMVRLVAACSAGAMAYFAAAAVLRCHELGWLLKRH